MASNFKTPTPEQLDAVTIVIDEATRQQFYLVRSASDVTVTYQVRWNSHYSRWSCQCKGNAAGYVCWHLRAALEVGREHAELKRAEAEAAARIATEDAEMIERVTNARPYRPSRSAVERATRCNQSKPFSLLR